MANHMPVKGLEPYKEKKNEDYMSDAQKEHIKVILIAWRQDLLNEVDRTVNHLRDEPSNLADPNDMATQEEEFALELRTRDRERKLIGKIEKTLSAINHEDFGYCTACGIEIGLKRLEARPTATLCIDCKTLQEIQEKHVA